MKKDRMNHVLNYIRDTRIEQADDRLQEQVRKCFLDLIMTTCCGTRNQSSKAAVAYVLSVYSGEEATILRTGGKASLLGATLANAVAANALDIDDGFSLTKGHPGAGIIAGILAAAEKMDSSIGDVFSALLVGYEIAMRQGLALQDYYGFYHSTGSYAGVGTAAAVGKLMKISPEQLSDALGIADYFGPLVPCMRTVREPSLNKDGIYMGAKLGMEAVLLAKAGFDGKAHILSDEKYSDYVDSLESRNYVYDLYFKFFSCCRWAQGALTALKELKGKTSVDPDQIEQITVYSYGASGELYDGLPLNETEAQYNMKYPIAVYLIHGDFGPKESSTSRDVSDAVAALMKRIHFQKEPEYEKLFPAKRFTRVEITTADGSVLKSDAVEPLGEPDSGVTMQDIIDKGIRINSLYEPAEKVKEVIERITKAKYTDSFRSLLKQITSISVENG